MKQTILVSALTAFFVAIVATGENESAQQPVPLDASVRSLVEQRVHGAGGFERNDAALNALVDKHGKEPVVTILQGVARRDLWLRQDVCGLLRRLSSRQQHLAFLKTLKAETELQLQIVSALIDAVQRIKQDNKPSDATSQ